MIGPSGDNDNAILDETGRFVLNAQENSADQAGK